MPERAERERREAGKPRIYVRQIPAPFPHDEFTAGAFTEDGRCIAGHISSDIEWARYDMGLTSTRKHDVYAAEYPDGYELVDELSAPAALPGGPGQAPAGGPDA